MKRDLKGILGDLEEPTAEKKLKIEIDAGLEAELEKIIAHYLNRDGGRIFVNNSVKTTIKGINSLRPDNKIISEFCSRLLLYEDCENFADGAADYLSELVNRAFELGNNNFELYLNQFSTLLDSACWELRGKRNNRLRISVFGNVGYGFARGCEYADIRLFGTSTDDCPGNGSKYCTLATTSASLLKRLKEAETTKSKIYWINKKRENIFFAEVDCLR